MTTDCSDSESSSDSDQSWLMQLDNHHDDADPPTDVSDVLSLSTNFNSGFTDTTLFYHLTTPSRFSSLNSGSDSLSYSDHWQPARTGESDGPFTKLCEVDGAAPSVSLSGIKRRRRLQPRADENKPRQPRANETKPRQPRANETKPRQRL